MSITVASPDAIRSWSKGEVKNPETINYRTFKPEKGGLFCQRIFGPVRDYECACGKYKRIKYKGVICDRCGVEVTLSRVRRERMGHIELAVPVSHIWFLKCMPSRLGLMLDMTARSLERVIYYEDYIVIDPGKTPLQRNQLLTDTEYRQAMTNMAKTPSSPRWAREAVRDALANRPRAKVAELDEQMRTTRSKQIKKKLAKRLKVIQGFIHSQVPPRVDGPRGAARHPAGPAPARPPRRRPFRHLRPQRSLPPRHQPQQPPEEPDAAQDARCHHPQ